MRIYFPHLNYTVKVKAISHRKMRVRGADATATRIDGYNALVEYSKRIKRRDVVSVLAHEFVHVLQFICEEYAMDFVRERDHMAYTMQYLMDRSLGCRRR